MKLPRIIRLNLVSSAGGGGVGLGGSTGSLGNGSKVSFFPNSPPSPPKKLLTDDAMPRCAPITLLMVSNVPPDLSFIMISRASLCAGSRASKSLKRFCMVGRNNSRMLVADRSKTSI